MQDEILSWAQVWSPKTYELVATIHGHRSSVLCLCLSEDQSLLFSSAGDAIINVSSFPGICGTSPIPADDGQGLGHKDIATDIQYLLYLRCGGHFLHRIFANSPYGILWCTKYKHSGMRPISVD